MVSASVVMFLCFYVFSYFLYISITYIYFFMFAVYVFMFSSIKYSSPYRGVKLTAPSHIARFSH